MCVQSYRTSDQCSPSSLSRSPTDEVAGVVDHKREVSYTIHSAAALERRVEEG